LPENDLTVENDLALLSRAAQEAGQIALRYFRQNPKVWMKAGNSLVSEADLEVDAYLKRELLGLRPDYGWLSEETGDERGKRLFGRFFVVDPVDGTRGFIEQKTEWCISIAIVEDGRPIAGVLECPARSEHFLAQTGKPALLNGEPVRIAPPGLRSRRRVSCRQSMISRLPVSFVQSVTLETDISSLAYHLALLSSGQLDAVFIRPGCHDWDIAAADIILQQSGGMLTGITGQPVVYNRPPFCHGFLLASGNESFQNMLNVVRETDLG